MSMGSEDGEVGGGNMTYFTLSVDTTTSLDFLIDLKTLSGDADLYVSGRGDKPTFAIGNHDFKSTTCGDDSVHIPASFSKVNRPLVVGVYG